MHEFSWDIHLAVLEVSSCHILAGVCRPKRFYHFKVKQGRHRRSLDLHEICLLSLVSCNHRKTFSPSQQLWILNPLICDDITSSSNRKRTTRRVCIRMQRQELVYIFMPKSLDYKRTGEVIRMLYDFRMLLKSQLQNSLVEVAIVGAL